MAVHEDIPGIEASICVDGQPLQEYDTENDKVNHDNHAVKLHQSIWTTTKYVESQTDKEFTIKLALKDSYTMGCPRLLTKVAVDGQIVYSVGWFQTDYSLHRNLELIVQGPETRTASRTTFKPMRFSKIETTLDEVLEYQVQKDIARLSNVGEIAITVHRQELGVPVDTQSKHRGSGMVASKVHEKVLKGEARTHGASFGKARQAPRLVYWSDTTFIDGEDYPLVTFKFKYRSNEALKALMVIPRTPEPEPAPRDPYSLLTEEQRRKLDAIAESMVTGTSSKGDCMIKKEEAGDRKYSTRSKRAWEDMEIIDLTIDDSDDDVRKRRRVFSNELIDLSIEAEDAPDLSGLGNCFVDDPSG
ncbi:hypothetical protein L207DRAFT_568089 [Hyaloscypha variabilis F]|uniref:DUF7918 domain-containing protein n=1 Tax=Hyaloscypha variabilis (strain UAMH 11265 / GT02V1 / F) TaxID=1149755 RepID=A0A2J6RIU1_HYAVF|nr:hypothetical protein L207DRAFT_568089 [Hyaloscypha variabilis F]